MPELSPTATGGQRDPGPAVAPGQYPEKEQPVDERQEFLNKTIELSRALSLTNVATLLDETTLNTLGDRAKEDFARDRASRQKQGWEESYKDWVELAMQAKKTKNFPFRKAANVKHPLIALAALQFAARALPAIINGLDYVRGRVIGEDENGEKAARAARVGEHMSYQLAEEMEGWDDEMDELLLILSIVGCVFKKTYRGADSNRSEMVYAWDLVVNYWAKSLEKAQRVSHIYYLYPNEIEERVRDGRFLDVKLGSVGQQENKEPGKQEDQTDQDAAYEFIEQHRWIDLDGDGYQEPWIVTICTNTQKVHRISARFDAEGIKTDETGKILRIEPVHYFTQFTFMYSPDGGFYRRGFGSLGAAVNKTVNSVINQLLDAGTMANAGGGFLSNGITFGRGKTAGTVTFTNINQWKSINFRGDDIRKGIFPLPVREPSLVLFKLLEMMIAGSKELFSNPDILSGNLQHQEPAHTTLARIEQGLKVFSAVYLRVFRSLKCEYRKLFRLNRLYLDDKEYYTILDDQRAIARDDYRKEGVDVKPAASPNATTDAQKMFRAQILMEQQGKGLKDDVIMKRYLEAHSIPDVDELIPKKDDPPPPPTEAQVEQAYKQQNLTLEAEKIAIELRKVATDELNSFEERLNKRADTFAKIAAGEAQEEGQQAQQYIAVINDMKGLIERQDAVIRAMGSQNGKNTGRVSERGNGGTVPGSGTQRGRVPGVAGGPDNPEGATVSQE